MFHVFSALALPYADCPSHTGLLSFNFGMPGVTELEVSVVVAATNNVNLTGLGCNQKLLGLSYA